MIKRFLSKMSAMTLAELLVVFMVMGVVAGMTILVAKPSDRSYKYIYTRVFNAIGNAYYNTVNNMPKYITDHDSNPANANSKWMNKDFPTSGEVLCKMLLEYINDTSGGVDSLGNTSACQTAHNPAIAIPNVNTANIDNYTKDNAPDIIASNGVKMWIANAGNTEEGIGANKKTYEYTTLKIPRQSLGYTGSTATSLSDITASTPITVRYYVIIIDLNGKMKPNTSESVGSKLADIVAVALTDSYDVVPLGQPEIDKRYLSARVAYSTAHGTEESDVGTSASMTFLDAKRHAWGIVNPGTGNYLKHAGVYPHPDEVYSLNFHANNRTCNTNSAPCGGITGGPFAFNYNAGTTLYGVTGIYPATLKNQKYDDTNCVKPNSAGGGTSYDPDACYVRVDDFS